MDATRTAILETISAAGFVLYVHATDVQAINERTGERFIVRYDEHNFYDAVKELAQQVGLELDDE